ncbi:adenosine kinase [Oscillatoria sp. FACHB-1406]|uniref:adenosine kinase n=1 Tax=Oscillatoria sp. FACHB-1406 TaxID=2692846 RepID=UPI0016898629|nr:adenosine kinase [Oscillatoria sp. FACHB-1406]MBD2576659.1 adenosine kinase [Oscillatoria sp. FACHB-1406]
MNQYNVYGLGNALVDMEYEVTPEKLQELNIDKGVMTLMDEERQHHVLERLDGHFCKQSCGGSAANTMVAISQFGGKSFYSCKVADDETGSFYLKDLLGWGIETNLQTQERENGITGKCLVMVTPDADRTMNTFLGITSTLAPTELIPEALQASDYLYLEGYLVSSPTAKEAAIRAREIARSAGVKVSLSLSDPNMVEFFKPGLLEMIDSGLDLIFANESEALKMADSENLEDAIAHFKQIAKNFTITRGAKGSLVYDGQELLEIAPTKVDAIDTVGAGDMYAGAFLYGITHGMNYTEAGTLASAASAKVVTCFGPRLTLEEIQALKG